MKISDDETIFAWTNLQAPPDMEHGLLATSPAYHSETLHAATLNCLSLNRTSSLAIYLKKLSISGHYARVKCAELTNFHTLNAQKEGIRVRRIPTAINSQEPYEIYGLKIRKLLLVEHGYKIVGILYTEKSLTKQLESPVGESE